MKREELKKMVAESPAEHTEIFCQQGNLKLSRFAESIIHQNISQETTNLTVVVHDQKRKGSASTTDPSPASVRQAIERAQKAASFQKPDLDFPGLPFSEEIAPDLPSYSEKTANCSPEKRAKGIAEVRSIGEREGFKGFGTFSTQANRYISLNSSGNYREWETSQAFLKVLYMGGPGGGEGFAQDVQVNVDDLKIAEVAEKAAKKCAATQGRESLQPGEYTVILEPLAVCELLGYLSFIGFNGLACNEGRSFFTGKIGEQVMAESISIIDDPYDENGLPFPYDGEGMPKRPIPLVEEGVYKNYVYDHYLAKKEDRKSTGHGLPPGFRTFGAMPMHLKMRSGEETKDQLLQKVEKGVLVTRFHYVGVIHPQKTIITGLTRDGTFWVGNGKIEHALKNLRFTQNIIEALKKVVGVGDSLGKMPFQIGAPQAPALVIDGFNFTGVSEME